MKYIEQIKNFIPTCEEEQQELELFFSYLNKFENVLTWDNKICHLTSSAFVINKQKTKVLCIYHNIYDSWCWMGGHADGDDDMIYVAQKEAMEESSIKNLKLLSDQIISLDVAPVFRHYRKGKYVPSHIHLSVAYLFEADKNEKIKIQEQENSNVAWLTFDELIEKTSEKHMIPIYKRIIDKVHRQT